jgi:hypothetical protein
MGMKLGSRYQRKSQFKVFEKGVLKGLFGLRRIRMHKLHYDKLFDSCASTDMIGMIKPRRIVLV